jgi:uncharacterized protein
MYNYTNQSDNRLVSADRQAEVFKSEYGTEIKIQELMKFLKSHFRLDWTGIHGAPHWSRVLLNGTKIAQAEGARLDVVTLFAFLHDHERINDDEDWGHGPRAALNAKKLRGTYFTIDDTGFDLLIEAMCGHSTGDIYGNITVQTCYDADRLDLGRVGIVPNPKYLCTATAKDPDFLNEAYLRSIRQ